MFASKPQKAGVIGLGIIGSRIAHVLREAGIHVYVWNRSPKTVPNFLSSPAGVAELVEHIHIFVRNGEDLLEVVGKMAPALTKKHFVINNSTVSVDDTKKAAEAVAETGATFVDCPFTGSKLAADAGELVYYVSTPKGTLNTITPLLELSSKEILHVSDNPGDATVLKIATNMISATTVEVLAESLALTRSQDIPAEKLAEALELNACSSPLTKMKLLPMDEGDFDPHFSLKNMFKDAQFALRLASDAGIEIPALSTTAGIMFNTIRKGHGDEDYSVLYSNFTNSAKEPEETSESESENAKKSDD